MKEKTAVDWLIEELESKGDAWENASIRKLNISIDVSDYLEIKRRARVMQREQLAAAWVDGHEWEMRVDEPDNASGYFTEKYGE